MTESMTFAGLGVPAQLVDALTERGITTPFPIQTLTIPDALAGRDVCGQAKTGSGKTLAFGIPLVARAAASPGARPNAPTALVLVPTRELAAQVEGELVWLSRATGRRVAAVYGGVSMDRQRVALKEGADIVVATPGRLIDLIGRGDIGLNGVEQLVLDEADRMCDMGFLPNVEWLIRQIGARGHQTLLFSATLGSDVNSLVKHYMNEPVRHGVEALGTVEQSKHLFFQVHQLDRVKVAGAIVSQYDRALLFTNTKRGCDRLVMDLKTLGVQAKAIHGDLAQSQRDRALRQFTEGQIRVLVATDVAARGIHVEGVDVVIQFDPPDDHKTYLHRAGRTARAGATGVVVTLALWNQLRDIERLQKRLGLSEPVPEVFSNDKRLTDLSAWDSAA